MITLSDSLAAAGGLTWVYGLKCPGLGTKIHLQVNGNAGGRASVSSSGSGVVVQNGPTFIGSDGKGKL